MADKLDILLETLATAADNKRFRKIDYFVPYAKQQEFFDLGASKRERLLIAGNQLGKSEAGAVEANYHMTGEYPDGWLGKRFERPTRGWLIGETGLLVRDVQQKKLMGQPGVEQDVGTGYIPKALIVDKNLARGVTDAFDTIQVRHVSGGVSTATFKSYEQGRTKFQGEPIDWAWCDEEPPADIYSEIVTRTNATKGIVWTTFTPLKGISGVVRRFLEEVSLDRATVTMTIYDALHYTPAERASIIAAYPSHEREARAMGVPILGSGRIFPYPEELIAEDALEYIPPHWVKLWGVDFGIDHPFAAALILWDKDNDVIHVHHTYRQSNTLPIMHAAAMRPIGAAVPVAWPQDGTARRGELGETVAQQYKKHNLLMLGSHATWPDGGISTEAGVMEMQERMQTGRLRVARHLTDWWQEFRLYHRKDGLIVKVNDDLLSATRIALMMKRYGRAVQLGAERTFMGSNGGLARDVDFDLFG